MMIDFSTKDVLSFDCYGTLIDWETGILSVLQPILTTHGLRLTDDKVLETLAAFEAAAEAGPYMAYRAVLATVLRHFGQHYGFQPTDAELVLFSGSVGDWPAFPDTAEALAILKKHFKLAIISNVDDDLFAQSQPRLGVAFDWIITAQQVQSYKPSQHNFDVALARIGLRPDRLVHVAQSIFHDHVPAKNMGLTTIWVNRRQGKAGFGATPPATATPDLVVPDLATLAEIVCQ